ncbi:putative 60S ribosomal protein L24 [Blattamonas nauphoetae]|uniref:60S ribosomal protein L24 n=1 Tax=Blattamonas nauphoetae TaxID=2049346 RepID=A0ABQ9X4V5_9EUKA|nr:putative 60S ribosomal protein L24 [Blattamonas nauphoetae]KAK2951438.1 putative 60S ribosomal protein L24 [Blattamonas nauphoetae]
MRVEKCSFSWRKIYPGHGLRYVRADSRVFIFSSSKSRRCFEIKRSSRTTSWTGDYRKIHKKDTLQQQRRRNKRKAVRFQKDIVGMTLDEIRKQKTQKVVEKPTGAAASALREKQGRNKGKDAGKIAQQKAANIAQQKAQKNIGKKGR